MPQYVGFVRIARRLHVCLLGSVESKFCPRLLTFPVILQSIKRLLQDGRVDVVANDAGDRCTPAVVAWNQDEVLVGSSAAQYGARNPGQCVKHNQKMVAFSTDVSKYKHEVIFVYEKPFSVSYYQIILTD